jgi:hypothetical protein
VPLAVPPRVLAGLAVRHLHPEVSIFEDGHPEMPFVPPYRFWRVPGHNGIILHSFYGVPLLMDYGAIETHDLSCLDEDAYENVYLRRNFYREGGLHVVRDSDEFAILSVTPEAVCQKPTSRLPLGSLARLDPCVSIRVSMGMYARHDRDALKRDTFRQPIRWHADDLDAAWHAQERMVEATVERAVGDYFKVADERGGSRFPARFTLDPRRVSAEMILWFWESALFRKLVRGLFAGVRSLGAGLRGTRPLQG